MQPIGPAAKLSGVNIETIRYYERAGVVAKAERSASGRRLYGKNAIVQLRFVKRCRELGFSIADIKSLLAIADGGRASCDEARAIGEGNLALVQDKIADLRRMEKALAELIGHCQAGQSDCPMLQRLFDD